MCLCVLHVRIYTVCMCEMNRERERGERIEPSGKGETEGIRSGRGGGGGGGDGGDEFFFLTFIAMALHVYNV